MDSLQNFFFIKDPFFILNEKELQEFENLSQPLTIENFNFLIEKSCLFLEKLKRPSSLDKKIEEKLFFLINLLKKYLKNGFPTDLDTIYTCLQIEYSGNLVEYRNKKYQLTQLIFGTTLDTSDISQREFFFENPLSSNIIDEEGTTKALEIQIAKLKEQMDAILRIKKIRDSEDEYFFQDTSEELFVCLISDLLILQKLDMDAVLGIKKIKESRDDFFFQAISQQFQATSQQFDDHIYDLLLLHKWDMFLKK